MPEQVDRSNSFIIYGGLVKMAVCVPSDATDEQIEKYANAMNPTGIDSRWGEPTKLHDCPDKNGQVHVELTC